MDANREPILATARDLYGRVSYTHKTHEKDRELWGRWGCVTLWVNIVLSALTTLFAIISAWLAIMGAVGNSAFCNGDNSLRRLAE